jgi:hypothetical protein
MLGAVLSPILAHLWNTYSDAYTTYGRLYFLSLPPELVGLYALRTLRGGGSGALERWGFRLSLAGMWLAVIGVFTDYRVTVPPGFLLVLVATPFLVAGFVLLGVGWRRTGAVPGWTTLVMIGTGVGAIPVMFFVFFHLPSWALLTFHIAWISLGYILWSRRGSLAGQPSRVSWTHPPPSRDQEVLASMCRLQVFAESF